MAPKLINKLSDAHRETFPRFVEEWTAIGRSTEPTDREATITAVGLAYAAADLPAPRVVFAVSPIGGAITREILRAGVGDGVWVGVRDGVGDGVADGVRDRWHKDLHYNCHEAGWLSWHAWFAAQPETAHLGKPMEGLLSLARLCGWVWFHRNVCIVSDRPATLHDELTGRGLQRRMHNPTGPSATWRDGWAIWHWHGLHVPQWVIENPDPIPKIQAEKNTEIRHAAIERIGWDVFLDRIGVTPVDVAPDPGNPGHTLQLFDIPSEFQAFGEPVRLLVMENASLDRDGTRRRFAETVPVDAPDAVSAAAWQFGVNPALYRCLVRAT